MSREPRRRLVEDLVALAEAEADEALGAGTAVECAERDGGDASFDRQIAAKGFVAAVEAERRVVGDEEIGAGAGQPPEAGGGEPGRETVALTLLRERQAAEIAVVLSEPEGHRLLQIGGRGEGDKLVRAGDGLDQRRSAGDP